MTPLERAEALYRELVSHYGDAKDAELRAAAKLLMVAIAEFKRHGGMGWQALLDDYVEIAKKDPDRFDRMVRASRTPGGRFSDDDEFLC